MHPHFHALSRPYIHTLSVQLRDETLRRSFPQQIHSKSTANPQQIHSKSTTDPRGWSRAQSFPWAGLWAFSNKDGPTCLSRKQKTKQICGAFEEFK
jgi:hypothetical protein